MALDAPNTSPIGIVGCGLIADTHVEAILAARPQAEIHVVDPMPGKAELLRSKYALKASYRDAAEMLRVARPFSVHVLSPPHWHIRHARQCLEAGAHVLVEKPLCFSVAEARELYAVAEASGRQLCVDHSLMFQPSIVAMRNALREFGAGALLHFDCFYGLDAGEGLGAILPAAHWKKGIPGGELMDSLVHPISLAVGLTGEPRELAVTRISRPEGEQLKVFWKTDETLIAITIAQGAQPFRRVTTVVTSAVTCLVDHATEVLVVQGPGFGPRSLKKLSGNLKLGGGLIGGTFQTVWKVLRGRIQQNPGARSLIAAYYGQLAGRGDPPISEAAVIHTTMALERVAELMREAPAAAPAPGTAAAVAAAPAPAQPSRRVLVTGASGFLGRTLCASLAASGAHRVIAQVRRGANADKLAGPEGLEKRYLDFDQFAADDYRGLLEGVVDVVHCAHAAGAKTWSDYEKRNVGHSLALYEAAAAAGCKRFIHISSLAVYGVHRIGKGDPLDESVSVAARGGRWEFYIRSKALAEQALLERASRGGPRLLILRPGILYAATGERLFAKSIPTRNGRLFVFIGKGRNHLPYTRVDSVAGAIVRALELEPMPTGVFNLSGAQTETMQDFLQRRCAMLGVMCRFIHLPPLPLRAAAFALESLSALTGRRRAPRITRYVINSATRDLLYDCSAAQRALGWDPQLAVRP